jgi:hypothetical protein
METQERRKTTEARGEGRSDRRASEAGSEYRRQSPYSARDRQGADLAPTITELQAARATTLQCIASVLNRRGIPTLAGRGQWQPVQVSRNLRRLAG